MFGKVRSVWRRFLNSVSAEERTGRDSHGHNLFEAAAAYASAYIEDDQDGMDEAAGWVSPGALSFGVNELACRAVVALARERDESPRRVARALLGLPAP
ncbi:hypothetical protein [Streptomyces sp. CRN 30]|uniref:hypothetical protein n=1 Tax=Streptomyces sp. CRN 30 TaxID=3075613 RepID=UPI002A7F299E|nr:hypothetical protein [Streptomyces sp. CRN 30]